MSGIKETLNAAADRLDRLHEGSEHIPDGIMHDREFRRGLVRTETERVAQFYYGGAAEVFIALGPESVPLLADLLRALARDHGAMRPQLLGSSLVFAKHVLNTTTKEHGS